MLTAAGVLNREVVDVAVVGGGLAGLPAATALRPLVAHAHCAGYLLFAISSPRPHLGQGRRIAQGPNVRIVLADVGSWLPRCVGHRLSGGLMISPVNGFDPSFGSLVPAVGVGGYLAWTTFTTKSFTSE